MLLGHRCSRCTDRTADYARRFSSPRALPIRSRRVIDGILEYTRNRTVVLGRREDQGLRGSNFTLQSHDVRVGMGIVVLIVERKIVYSRPGERQMRRREPCHGVSELAIDRIFAQAPDQHGDLNHDGAPWHATTVSILRPAGPY